MRPLQWAIVGPGRIAHRFAQAVNALPEAELRWVLSREASRGQAFAQAWSVPGRPPVRVATELATLLAQPDVDAVYVATPHAQHAAPVHAALAAGKPVLCEKPLVTHLAAGEALVALARARGVFLMEAVWTRFLPVYEQVGTWLREGRIGRVTGLQSSFCFHTPYDPASRLFDPALAGGALLDIGIYNLTMTRWVMQQALGRCPEATLLQAHGRRAPSGVDLHLAGTVVLQGGAISQFVCALDRHADNGLGIHGEHGHIRVPHRFWEATEAVLQRHGEPPVVVEAPFAINGFEGEILEATRCIREGRIESPAMDHDESLATLGWMDTLRSQLGVRYPFE